MLTKFLEEILKNHRGKAFGVIIGLVFGWFAINYGLFKAVFVTLCIGVGYFLGKGVDENFDFRGALSRLFRDRW